MKSFSVALMAFVSLVAAQGGQLNEPILIEPIPSCPNSPNGGICILPVPSQVVIHDLTNSSGTSTVIATSITTASKPTSHTGIDENGAAGISGQAILYGGVSLMVACMLL